MGLNAPYVKRGGKMGIKIITHPAIEPVTLSEIKEHLRISYNDDDSLIETYITVAREYCEQYQNRAYITQTIEQTLDDYPSNIHELPRPPLQSVTSIKYTSDAGIEATYSSNNYVVDIASFVGRVALKNNLAYPTTTLQSIAGVKIRYVAGYGNTADTVPSMVKHAIKLIVGHLYENRENIVEKSLSEIPMGVKSLLDMNRKWNI
jgi:uncharacterized phiE125 gp8 family phage protein